MRVKYCATLIPTMVPGLLFGLICTVQHIMLQFQRFHVLDPWYCLIHGLRGSWPRSEMQVALIRQDIETVGTLTTLVSHRIRWREVGIILNISRVSRASWISAHSAMVVGQISARRRWPRFYQTAAESRDAVELDRHSSPKSNWTRSPF